MAATGVGQSNRNSSRKTAVAEQSANYKQLDSAELPGGSGGVLLPATYPRSTAAAAAAAADRAAPSYLCLFL